MAAIEEPPSPGDTVQIFSRSGGGWVMGRVESVKGEEATVLYQQPTAQDPSRASRKVVDWDDPEQLLSAPSSTSAADAAAAAAGASSSALSRNGWAGVEDDVEDLEGGPAGAHIVTHNPLSTSGARDSFAQPPPMGKTEPAPEPAPAPDALLAMEPRDTSDVTSMFAWMRNMIVTQHKDIFEMRGMIESGAVPRRGGAADDDDDDSGREKTQTELASFIHNMAIFKNALAIDATQKDEFIKMVTKKLERRKYFRESMIIKKGAEATEMYFIWSGLAEVFLDHPDASEESKIPPVAKLAKGTYFGEAALLSDKKEVRNAWIRAKGDMEVYALGSSDLREALEAYPVMGTLFNTEKHRMDAQRDAHFRRFATGGGNFRKGFKVKLRALGEREQLGQRVSEELETAFDPVPVAFSRDAVEALLLTKMQEMEDLRDQLGAAGVVEKDKELEEQEQGPLTKEQKRKTYLQMGTLAAIFFSLCFVPYISVQHHAQDVLLATSASHPALLHMSYYSEYRVDVVATIEGQPRGGIKQTSEADHVTEVTRSETSSNGDTGTGDRQRGDSASHGRRLQGSDPHDHHPHVTPTPQPSPSPTRPVQDCPIVDGYCDRGRPCRCVLDEQERLWEIEETHATLQAYIVRCDHEVAEHIAHGFINISHAMDPSTPRNRGVDIVDEGHLIKMKPEAQRMHVEFGMDGDMRDIDHEVEHVYLLVVTSSPDPIAMSLEVHDLGYTGPLQEWIALMILVIVFGMIVLEIVHHTLAAMFGSYMVLCVLAVQHRMPEISEVVGWMDHGTLALLWGMMIIVGVVAKTGVFEYMAVRLYKMSGGDPFRLLLLICFLDIILSAFLDNVTTMLLLAPVCVQLCEAVGRDPRPFLISLALFGNVGGTATMIGDPPNIIIGNMLHEYVTFNDFIIFLSPGVILCLPLSFFITKIYFGDSLSDKMEVNVEQLIKDNPIKNHRLLIKTGVMLCCVIIGFFLHPVTHIDPVFVAIPGAIAVFFLDNSHDVEDALHGVEWETLLFFAALFVMVEGLAEMGLLRKIASILADVIEDIPVASRQPMAIVLVNFVSAITSAFVDNIPFTTTMVPVIKEIAEQVEGVRIEPLIWSLSFGSCLGGMGTLIGASDNVVMAGIAEKAGFHVSFISFMKIGFPIMLECVLTCTIWLLVLDLGFDVWPNEGAMHNVTEPVAHD